MSKCICFVHDSSKLKMVWKLVGLSSSAGRLWGHHQSPEQRLVVCPRTLWICQTIEWATYIPQWIPNCNAPSTGGGTTGSSGTRSKSGVNLCSRSIDGSMLVPSVLVGSQMPCVLSDALMGRKSESPLLLCILVISHPQFQRGATFWVLKIECLQVAFMMLHPDDCVYMTPDALMPDSPLQEIDCLGRQKVASMGSEHVWTSCFVQMKT